MLQRTQRAVLPYSAITDQRAACGHEAERGTYGCGG